MIVTDKYCNIKLVYMKNTIIKKYQSKILAYYHSDNIAKFNNSARMNLQSKDLSNMVQLINFFDGLADREASITKSGFGFLEEYYGLDRLASILKKANPRFPYDDNVKNLINWLLDLKKYADEDVE